MVDTPKVVFTKTMDKSPWQNTTLATGDLDEEVRKLKESGPGDIILYGGSGLASSMASRNLIDEYFLFINPVTLGAGKGLPVFSDRLKLQYVRSIAFPCGIVLLNYKKLSS